MITPNKHWFKRLWGRISLLMLAGILTATTSRGQDIRVARVELIDTPTVGTFQPGDPISWRIWFQVNPVGTPPPPGRQEFWIETFLTTDGDPENQDNYELYYRETHVFGGTAINAGVDFQNQHGPGLWSSTVHTARLPRNFTGNYFLVARAYVRSGVADPDTTNNYPPVGETAGTRISIASADSPIVSRVSESTSGGAADEFSDMPTVSENGRYVVFYSAASNLAGVSVPANYTQVYLKDTVTGAITLVSKNLSGTGGNGNSRSSMINAGASVSGGYIVFESEASNLVANDTNNATDIFLYEINSGKITLLSKGLNNAQANRGSYAPSISDDGTWIVFESDAFNLVAGDTNGVRDIFLVHRNGSGITLVSHNIYGTSGNATSSSAKISGDGSAVAFRSYATNLVSNKSTTVSDIYVATLDSASRTLVDIDRVSIALDGTGNFAEQLDRDSFDPAISKTGRYVAFATRSTRVLVPSGAGPVYSGTYSQVYVINRDVSGSGQMDQSGNRFLRLVSAGQYGTVFANDDSEEPMISGNGRFIGYRTMASDLQYPYVIRSDGTPFFTPDIARYFDDNGSDDVYRLDTGIQSIIVTNGGSGYTQDSTTVSISGGGGSGAKAVAWIEQGVVVRIDITNAGAGFSTSPTVTINGTGAGATANATLAPSSELLSLNKFGAVTNGILGQYHVPASRSVTMSKNGRYLVFASDAENRGSYTFGISNLRPLDDNGKRDIFLIDLRNGETPSNEEGGGDDGGEGEIPIEGDEIVDAVYQSLFFRSAQPTDIAAINLALKGGITLAGTAAYAVESDEFRIPNSSAEAILAYRAALGLYQSPEEYENAMSAIKAGSLATYLNTLYASVDYASRFGQLIDPTTLQDADYRALCKKIALQVYRNLYGGKPKRDTDTLAYTDFFYDYLRSGYGAATAQFIYNFVSTESTSYKRAQVAALIIILDDRRPDPAEVDSMAKKPIIDAAYTFSGDPLPSKPVIASQPANFEVTAGGTATFAVTASGTPPPAYQWLKGGKPIAGATESSYTIVNVSTADAAKYSVRVENSKGKVTSKSATLKVLSLPPVYLGDTVSYKAGSAPTLDVGLGSSESGLKYYAKGLPKGLKINALTGEITGSISAKAGTYNVTYWTQAGKSKSAIQTLTFVVEPPLPPAPIGTDGALAWTHGGGSFDQSVKNTAPEAAGLTYEAKGLPKGLKIDKNTGQIYGNITAKPGTYTVTYWSKAGSTKSDPVTLQFTVDAFPFEGDYDALFVDSTDHGLPAGKVTVKITYNGAFTGKLYYQNNKTYSFKGIFGLNGAQDAASVVLDNVGRSGLNLDLYVTVGGKLEASTLADGATGYWVEAQYGFESLKLTNPKAPVRTYTVGAQEVWINEVGSQTFFDLLTTAPLRGDAKISVSSKNVLSFKGTAADGTKITTSTTGSDDGSYLLFVNPNKKIWGGYFSGELNLNLANNRFDDPDQNDLRWSKPSPDNNKIHSGAFGPLDVTIETK